MLLHGLKNQLLVANILARKMNKNIQADDFDKAELLETSNKLLAISTEMSEKLSYLYKSVDSVNTVLTRVSTTELLDAIKVKVAAKDTENIVTYSTVEGTVIVDKELISEAIFNIVSNAIEAVQKVTSRKVVVVRIAIVRNHVLISVADNGCGMSEEIKNKIFMPFTSSKNSSTNWGLGLCYARRIIRQHMGEVRVDSKEGQGTIFYVTLPKYTK